MLDLAVSQGKEAIVLGDCNCDLVLKRPTIPELKQLKTLFKILHLTQLINEPTRIAQDSRTLLDLIATSSS